MNSKSFRYRLNALRHTTARLVLPFAALAALCIGLSGNLLAVTVPDPLLQGRIQLARYPAFIAFTSGMPYLLPEVCCETSQGLTAVRA